MASNAAPELPQPDDVVQLDPEHCPWGAIFVVVVEVRSWGIKGYFLVPGEEGIAPVRVNHGHYVRIGRAEWAMRRP